MKLEEDIKKYLTSDERAQLQKAAQCLLDCEAGKVTDEKLRKDAEAQFDLFAKRIAERKALAAIQPSIDDAQRFLDGSELQWFLASIPGAIDAYLQGPLLPDAPSSWLWNQSAYRYLILRSIIEERQRKAASRMKEWEDWVEATDRKIQLMGQTCAEIEEFEKSLSKKKQDPQCLFAKLKDPRYVGISLETLLLPDKRRQLDRDVESWVSSNAVPGGNMGRFIIHEYKASYFPLPWGEYVFHEEEEIPCLDFSLDVFAIVEVTYWKTLSLIKRDSYSVIKDLKEPQFMGYRYERLRLGDFSWECIPVNLLQNLMAGELQSVGVKVSEIRRDGDIFYSVDGVEDEIRIPRDLRTYLAKVKQKGGLVSLGIISLEAGTIIEHLPPKLAGTPQKKLDIGDKDVVDALVALGWKVCEAKKAIAGMSFPADATLEQKVTLALRNLGGGVDKDKNSLTNGHFAQESIENQHGPCA